MPASPTRIHASPSTEVPTPSDYAIYNLGAHSDLPLLYGPSSGASPSTRIRIPNTGSDKARRTRIRRTSPWATLRAPVPPTRNLQTENDIVPAPDGHATAKLGAHLHLPVLYGPSTVCPLTRIQTTNDKPLIRKRNRTPVSVRVPSQALTSTCWLLRAMTQAAAPLDSDPDTRMDKPTRAAAQDQLTSSTTHTRRALPDLPLLTDQVCRKADSDGPHPAGPVTSQACRSLRTRLSTARTPTRRADESHPYNSH